MGRFEPGAAQTLKAGAVKLAILAQRKRRHHPRHEDARRDMCFAPTDASPLLNRNSILRSYDYQTAQLRVVIRPMWSFTGCCASPVQVLSKSARRKACRTHSAYCCRRPHIVRELRRAVLIHNERCKLSLVASRLFSRRHEKDLMDQSQAEAHVTGGSRRSWVLALTSLLFVLLQSACTAVMAISGLRLLIGVTSLAASILPGFIFTIHAERIRIPMLVLAVLGSVVNLYVLWRIWSLRSRPASQWRTQPVTPKQRRSEKLQFVISILTLALVITESLFHHHLHGSF